MGLVKMTLGHACPTCGCEVVVCEGTEVGTDGESIRQHTNGQRWDYRVFLCGRRIVWSPNFARQEMAGYNNCKRDPKYIAKCEAMQEIDQQIKALREQKANLI
jgi:hypothetical protein